MADSSVVYGYCCGSPVWICTVLKRLVVICDAMLCRAVCNTVLFCVLPTFCSALLCSALPCPALLCCAVLCCSIL